MRFIRYFLCSVMLMLFMPVLQAKPQFADALPATYSDSDASASTANLNVSDIPATPFVLTARDIDYPGLSLHSAALFHQTTFTIMAADPGDESYNDNTAFKPGHPVDYGAFSPIHAGALDASMFSAFFLSQ